MFWSLIALLIYCVVPLCCACTPYTTLYTTLYTTGYYSVYYYIILLCIVYTTGYYSVYYCILLCILLCVLYTLCYYFSYATVRCIPQVETFSVLHFIFLKKLLHSCLHSTTLQHKLKWLRLDTELETIDKYFPSRTLKDLHNVTDDTITVSIATLLEATQQILQSYPRETDRHRERRHHRRQGESQKVCLALPAGL